MSDKRVLSINVGQIETVLWSHREFTTAIRKRAVDGVVRIEGINAAGDDQADRTVHGGPSKAIYAYAWEDYDWWAREREVAPHPGLFGENLTTAGIDLNGALIGERWRVGGAILEVSEPRLPCYKLGFALDDPAFTRAFAEVLRPGTYFRIVEPGDVAAGSTLELVSRPDSHDVTVRDVMRIRLFAHEERHRLVEVEQLDDDWRAWAMSPSD